MRRVSLFIGGLVLALIATLAFSGPAPAAPSTRSADPSATPSPTVPVTEGDEGDESGGESGEPVPSVDADDESTGGTAPERTETPSSETGVKSDSDASKATAKAKKRRKRNWNPRASRIISDPTVGHRQRVVLNHVVKAIRNTRSRQIIRIAVWNFDDRATKDALIRAIQRGVRVQLIVSYGANTDDFQAVKRAIKRRKHKWAGKRSLARRCVGSCRQKGKGGIMHAKFLSFSKVGGRAKHVTMFGSINLTYAAGVNQWNDLVTVRKPLVYRHYVRMFNRFRRDRVDRPLYRQFSTRGNDIRSSFFPANEIKYNPILKEFRKVKCRGAAKGYGNGNRRTKIRIAIAGWFDVYGARIAQQVRRLWDRGCDVKIVNTLTGRGINKALRNPRGRGPVPTREVTTDPNGDGIPDKYLHLKFFTIDGVYRNNPRSRVLFTGSGNWTERARRSDEVLVRMKWKKWARYYGNYVDRLYASPWAHGRQITPATMRAAEPAGRSVYGQSSSGLPDWDW
ncbi:MAG: phospholipase D-like domain-containing protein [Nocardioides sp.]|nr:phospholipase D-like domain-containing protein [Nocardioides sp.]